MLVAYPATQDISWRVLRVPTCNRDCLVSPGLFGLPRVCRRASSLRLAFWRFAHRYAMTACPSPP